MSYHLMKLRDVCDFIDGDRGKNYPSNGELTSSVSCLFLNTGNVTKNGFNFEKCQFITAEKDSLLRKGKLRHGDVVLTTRGTLGNVGFFSNKLPYHSVRINSGMLILRASAEFDPRFLFYAVQSPMFQAQINGVKTGSAQPQLPLKTLKEMKVSFPSREGQERIAGVLSAYDELIENNRRQIKLLEEAAQRLYKEWFIDLKFPGHETTPIVDGLPEGWKYGILDDLLDECGARMGMHEREMFEHYLPIDSLPSKSFTCWESRPICEAESSLLAFKENDFIFGAMRPYFHKVVVAPYAGITRSTCFVLCSRDAMASYFAYMSLFWEQTIRYATSISVGTTMPYVRWSDLKRMKLVIPRQDVQRSYSSMVASVFEEILVLEKHIATAREARDRLLPKLMSGEIEV